MAFYDAALNFISNDITSGLILVGAGFLLNHLIHAIRYAFFGGFGSFFEKIKKFFKILLFLNI